MDVSFYLASDTALMQAVPWFFKKKKVSALKTESLQKPRRLSNYFKDPLGEICNALLKYAAVTAAVWSGVGARLRLPAVCAQAAARWHRSAQRPPPACQEGIKPPLPGELPPVPPRICLQERDGRRAWKPDYCCHQHVTLPAGLNLWHWDSLLVIVTIL